MIRLRLAICGLVALAACSGQPDTDGGLAAVARQAVNHRLGRQATFSQIESTAVEHIACGHAVIPGPGGRAAAEQDFVYRDGRLIMDDDPDFDTAASACDAAASAPGQANQA